MVPKSDYDKQLFKRSANRRINFINHWAQENIFSQLKQGVLHVGSYKDLGLSGLTLTKARLLTPSGTDHLWKMEL